MRKVSVIGIGCTQFGKQNGVGIVDLAVQACGEALSDARVPRGCIDAFYLGNFVSETLAHQGSLAPIVAHRLGLGPIPCTKVEAPAPHPVSRSATACCSSHPVYAISCLLQVSRR